MVIAIGFWTTYTRPVLEGTYTQPWWGHIHGALAFAWSVLTIMQTQLVGRNIALHRALGISALLIIPAWFASTVMITREFALMTIARGDPAAAETNVVGSIASPFLVMILVILAVWLRANPQAHKRLIFVATLTMLWPAWARWRHYFADTDALNLFFGFFVAFTPILIAMLRDRLKFGAIHPALLWSGAFVIAEQVWEIMFYGSAAWAMLAKLIFNLIV